MFCFVFGAFGEGLAGKERTLYTKSILPWNHNRFILKQDAALQRSFGSCLCLQEGMNITILLLKSWERSPCLSPIAASKYTPLRVPVSSLGLFTELWMQALVPSTGLEKFPFQCNNCFFWLSSCVHFLELTKGQGITKNLLASL